MSAVTVSRPEELSPSGEWWIYERPFRHIRAQGVFRTDVYERLEAEFLEIRDRADGCAEPAFKKARSAYDALILTMHQQLASRFAPLFERRWIDFLAKLLSLEPIPQIDGALHHIPVNSRSGWVHNDFCSGWFNRLHRGEIIFPDRRNCDYFTGTAKSAQVKPQEFIRTATMIFYLTKDEWKDGCGGETGLYASSRGREGEMSAVPPISNSLLLFSCSPHSWHSLIGNPGCPRNSIILWLHSSVENAQARWGRSFTRRRPR
jgi:hypothetical protein